MFDPFYSTSTGTLYPRFTAITLTSFHSLGSVKYGGGLLTFAGYELNGQTNPLEVTLDGVVFDAAPGWDIGHNGGPTALPVATHFTLGPGPVSFAGAIVPSAATDVTMTGDAGTGGPYDCGTAFVPLRSVLPSSPF